MLLDKNACSSGEFATSSLTPFNTLYCLLTSLKNENIFALSVVDICFMASIMVLVSTISLAISFCPLFVSTLKSILASTFELMLVFTRSFVSLVVSLFSLVRSSEFSLSAISMLPLPRVARFLDKL